MDPLRGTARHTRFSAVGNAVLVAGLVLLVSATVLLVSAQGHLRQSNSNVQRANEALLQIAEINSLVIGVDYSARGYALTGQQLFLDHEHDKQQRLKRSVEDFAQLVGSDQQPAVGLLAKLVDQHAQVYAKFVTLGPGRTNEIAAIITSPAERQKRYDVQNVLARLHKNEAASLSSYQAETEREFRWTSILTFVIVVIVFLAGTAEVMARIVHRRSKD